MSNPNPPITLEAAEKIIADLAPLIPDENSEILKSLCRQAIIQQGVARDAIEEARKARAELEMLKRALEMYERECGEGGILFRQNLEICKQQVTNKR